MTDPLAKRLRKSRDKKLFGVCGGIAEYFDIDPTMVRVAWALLSLLTVAFPGVLLYVILALVMPEAGEIPPAPPAI
jgi:phage shock protein C